jgi:hypothetical protein
MKVILLLVAMNPILAFADTQMAPDRPMTHSDARHLIEDTRNQIDRAWAILEEAKDGEKLYEVHFDFTQKPVIDPRGCEGVDTKEILGHFINSDQTAKRLIGVLIPDHGGTSPSRVVLNVPFTDKKGVLLDATKVWFVGEKKTGSETKNFADFHVTLNRQPDPAKQEKIPFNGVLNLYVGISERSAKADQPACETTISYPKGDFSLAQFKGEIPAWVGLKKETKPEPKQEPKPEVPLPSEEVTGPSTTATQKPDAQAAAAPPVEQAAEIQPPPEKGGCVASGSPSMAVFLLIFTGWIEHRRRKLLRAPVSSRTIRL